MHTLDTIIPMIQAILITKKVLKEGYCSSLFLRDFLKFFVSLILILTSVKYIAFLSGNSFCM